MRARILASFASGLAMVLLLGAPLSAQAPGSQRAFQGLFGGAGGKSPDSAARHSLNLSLSLSEAYDSDTPREVRSVIGDSRGLQVDGFSTMFVGALDYGWQGSRVQFGASGSSAVRYETESREVRTLSHTAGLGLSARLPKSTTLFVNQTAAYSPSYLFGLFPELQPVSPGDAVVAAPDYAITTLESYSYGTTLSITHSPTPRTRITATGDFSYTDFLEETAGRGDRKSTGIRVRLARNVAANTALNAGYRYRTGNLGYAAGATAIEHGIDIGMVHSRMLSASRRAYMSLNLGSSTADAPQILAGEGEADQRYRVTGSLAVGYDFGRSWQGRATYRRGVEFLSGLSEPVYTDGVTTVLTGLLTPRIDVTASAGYSNGAGAFRQRGSNFDTYTVNTRVRVALSRAWAAYADYLYYFYDFREEDRLLAGFPLELTRHGVRAGITLWIPMLRR